MSKNSLKILGFLKTITVISGFFLIFAATCAAKPKITAIQAKLFYQNTGKFSEDVLTTPSDLWNVYFDYVYSTFVIVEIEGGDRFNEKQKLDFTARYIPLENSRKNIVIRQTVPLWFDETGKSFHGFWLDNIGCHPVKLSANIKGQKTIIRKTIDFGCGE